MNYEDEEDSGLEVSVRRQGHAAHLYLQDFQDASRSCTFSEPQDAPSPLPTSERFDDDVTDIAFGATVKFRSPPSHAVFVKDAPDHDKWDAIEEAEAAAAAARPKVKARPLPPDQRLTASQFYAKFVERTSAQCAGEAQAAQGSQAWKDSRAYCITGSQFGSALGLSVFQSVEDVLREKAWPKFNGNAMTEWGNKHEPHARESLCWSFGAYLRRRYAAAGNASEPWYELKEYGLLKRRGAAWAGMSPDGVLTYKDADGAVKTALVEFKCPAGRRDTETHPYGAYDPPVPPYYEAQVQGGAHLLSSGRLPVAFPPFDEIWFVVWQARRTFVTRLRVDAVAGADLFRRLREYYFTRQLPVLTHKYNGVLDEDQIYPSDKVSSKSLTGAKRARPGTTSATSKPSTTPSPPSPLPLASSPSPSPSSPLPLSPTPVPSLTTPSQTDGQTTVHMRHGIMIP